MVNISRTDPHPANRRNRRTDYHGPLPPGSKLYADKAYSDYGGEDRLKAERRIELLPLRKPNLKRQPTEEVAKALSRGRKRIETTFSQIAAKLPRRVHAITAANFESKVLATFVAFAILIAANEKQQTVGGQHIGPLTGTFP